MQIQKLFPAKVVMTKVKNYTTRGRAIALIADRLTTFFLLRKLRRSFE